MYREEAPLFLSRTANVSLENALKNKILTENDARTLKEQLRNNGNPEDQQVLSNKTGELIGRGEELFNNYKNLLKSSPFETQLHEGFLHGFLHETKDLGDKAREVENLKKYIQREKEFNGNRDQSSKEVKNCYNRYYEKYFMSIKKEDLLKAAFIACEIKADLNSAVSQKLLSPQEVKELLKEWELCPPNRLSELKKKTNQKMEKAKKLTEDYKKNLKIFIDLLKKTTPKNIGIGSIEADFWMYFTQKTKKNEDKEKMFKELKKFIDKEQKMLVATKNLSKIEKKEYEEQYGQYYKSLSKEQILTSVKKTSEKLASDYYKIFKDNSDFFSEQAITRRCRDFADLMDFDDQRDQIDKEKKEVGKIKEITVRFLRLPPDNVEKHKRIILDMTSAEERKNYLESIILGKPTVFKKTKETEQETPNETKQNVKSVNEKPITEEEKIEIQTATLLISHENLESTARAIIAANRESTESKAHAIINIAYWTNKHNELISSGHKKSAEDRAIERAETYEDRTKQEEQIEAARKNHRQQSIAISSKTDKKKSHAIERIDIHNFARLDEKRIDRLYHEKIFTKGESTEYRYNNDQFAFHDESGRIIGEEEAEKIKKKQDAELIDNYASQTETRLGVNTNKRISDEERTGIKNKIHEIVKDQTVKTYALNNDESFADAVRW